MRKGSRVLARSPYAIPAPVVFYGSFITHGGCASRPGNAYDAIVCRRMNADHINIGFSGSGRGDACIVEYIASMEMSAFVPDYDRNAANPADFKKTQEPFFQIVRKRHPECRSS